jgi:NAD+ kinase
MNIKAVSINIRPDDAKSIPLLKEISAFLTGKGIKIMLPDYNIISGDSFLHGYVSEQKDFIETPDIVIAIGGDGTFLLTARHFSETSKPIFGINRGRLGFLTEFLPEEAIEYLNELIKGGLAFSKRILLESALLREGSEINRAAFVNDAVISKGAFSRPIRLQLDIDGVFLNTYSGDGLIIATATGSTAYSLSAGGPIIMPLVENVYIINPVCPHTLAIRPMIVPASSVLKATILSDYENLLLTIDGQEAIRIKGGDEILFRKSHGQVKLITHPRHNYYEILRQKLGWGRSLDPQDKNAF